MLLNKCKELSGIAASMELEFRTSFDTKQDTEELFFTSKMAGRFFVFQNKESAKLFNAVVSGNIEKTVKFLKRGLNLNIKDRWTKDTPLHWLCWAKGPNKLSIAKSLIAGGANPKIKNGMGKNVLHSTVEGPASVKEQLQLLKYFLSLGVDINSKTRAGETVLMRALHSTKPIIIKFLLEHGSNPNIEDKGKTTPLLFSSFTGLYQVTKLLLEHGARVNHRNNVGLTALMVASAGEDTGLIELLTRHGANIGAKDKDGDTALSLATKYNRPQSIKYLQVLSKNSKKKLSQYANSQHAAIDTEIVFK